MDTSSFLAQLLGLVYTVVGISIALNFKRSQKLFAEYVKSPALVFLGGEMAVLIGSALVLLHNVWEGGWPILVTVLAWLTLLKGVGFLFFPEQQIQFAKNFMNETGIKLAALVSVALGVYLLYAGFYL